MPVHIITRDYLVNAEVCGGEHVQGRTMHTFLKSHWNNHVYTHVRQSMHVHKLKTMNLEVGYLSFFVQVFETKSF